MPWFSPSVETVRRRIRKAWSRGDAEGQERIAAAYARRRPDEPLAWVLWGNVRFKQRDFPGAERVLREGLALHPSADPDLGWLLARVVSAQRRPEEAKDILEEQARLFPRSRLPHLGLLELAIEASDWEEATRLAEETDARTPENSYAGKHELAYQLMQIPGRSDDAIALLRQIVEIVTEPGPPTLLLGLLLERKGDPESQRFIDLARRAWRAPTPDDRALEEMRTYVREDVPG
jgi:tetratricopeptide (TPR) repeat protein